MVAVKILSAISFIAPLAILLYPLFSYIRYRFFPRPIHKSEDFVVPVSIIIACYNEEKYIRNKIISFLDNDEWIEGSEIVVVSAGSTDNTNNILAEFLDNPSLNIILSKVQLAKIDAVNLAVDLARHDFLVFSDCRQKMKKGSLKQLIYNFNDENVGTVVATLNDGDGGLKQSTFRFAINKLAYYDSQSGSSLNVYGALYAQRKSVFKKFPRDLLFDDLCVIISTLNQNMRLIQEPLAVIYDVHFHSYYGGERLERLTRGLVLFITKQWSQIIKINKWDLFRFLIFKYAKLLLPFSIILWLILYVIVAWNINKPLPIILPLSFFVILVSVRKTRSLVFLMIRINVHFFAAIFKFFFLKKRSIRWEKLSIGRSSWS